MMTITFRLIVISMSANADQVQQVAALRKIKQTGNFGV